MGILDYTARPFEKGARSGRLRACERDGHWNTGRRIGSRLDDLDVSCGTSGGDGRTAAVGGVVGEEELVRCRLRGGGVQGS